MRLQPQRASAQLETAQSHNVILQSEGLWAMSERLWIGTRRQHPQVPGRTL